MTEYSKITIEAADGGWIVKQNGKPAHLFMRWEMLVKHIKYILTSNR